MTRIAICAPATPITRDLADVARALVADEYPGISLHFHEQCFDGLGHFAGADVTRLDAFLECANDDSFDAVWFAKGGYGSNRIASEAIERLGPAARNKAYVGYSDCGFFLGALYRAGIGQPVHGAMPVSCRSEHGMSAARRVLDWISGDNSGLEPSLDDQPVVAFNLTTLVMMAGTDLMPDLTDHVVIVEEVSEYLYAIDRLFFNLVNNLPPIAGLRLGEVTDVPVNDRMFSQDAEGIARFWCERNGINYLGRAKIGHTGDNHLVPFGLARSFKQA